MNNTQTYFLPYQERWILDESPFRIIQKSRQIGIIYADAYDSVLKASATDARLDLWILSRDQVQAKLYLESLCERPAASHGHSREPDTLAFSLQHFTLLVPHSRPAPIRARKASGSQRKVTEGNGR